MPTEMNPSLTAEMSVEECLLKNELLLRRLCVKGSEKKKKHSMPSQYRSHKAVSHSILKLT